jgi:hypothetical protein
VGARILPAFDNFWKEESKISFSGAFCFQLSPPPHPVPMLWFHVMDINIGMLHVLTSIDRNAMLID